ncbi:toxin TumE [Nodosilinea sp. PGN35]|uniref:toxin TumE n=1 Tax=Nodosilinea sp. PGN35 TaxID=3020489 RepID=UPI00398B8FFF
MSEALQLVEDQIMQIDYRYHFQDENNRVIFRYDSTPHFPALPTFPHHKHLPNRVISTEKPDLAQVFQEASTLAATKG